MRVLRIVFWRLIAAVPTLALVAIGVFILLSAAPGDAADAYLAQVGGDAGFAARLREEFGLTGGWAARFWAYLSRLCQGDLGQSLVFNRPVLGLILERLPITLLLMLGAVSFAALLGGGLGLVAGARPGAAADRIVSILALGVLSMPNFWLALLLIVGFSVSLAWLPVGGIASIGAGLEGTAWFIDRLKHLILPVIALGAGYVAMYLRSLRAGMADLWSAEHVKAARARGLKRPTLVWRHVARPALLPVIVLLGQQIGALFGGSVVVETVFAVPGMGRLAYEAVAGRDTMLMAGIVLGGAFLVIFVNLTVDLVLTWLDPRIGAVHDQ